MFKIDLINMQSYIYDGWVLKLKCHRSHQGATRIAIGDI